MYKIVCQTKVMIIRLAIRRLHIISSTHSAGIGKRNSWPCVCLYSIALVMEDIWYGPGSFVMKKAFARIANTIRTHNFLYHGSVTDLRHLTTDWMICKLQRIWLIVIEPINQIDCIGFFFFSIFLIYRTSLNTLP